MTNDEHRNLAEVIHNLKGFVIISGYPSKIYEELLVSRGSKRSDKEAIILSHAKRTESLWLSPSTAAKLPDRIKMEA